MKQKWKIAIAAGCAALAITGAYAAAAAAAGSEGDPLVTLGYLKNVFTGQVQTMVDETVAAEKEQAQTQLDAAIQDWDAQVSQAVSDALNRPQAETPAVFTSVSGEKVSVMTGCEIIVRSGSPVCSVALIDQTDGATLAAGSVLKANHLYLAASDGVLSPKPGDLTGVVKDGPLNVRSGAGKTYSRVGTLQKGAAVKVLDRSTAGWYKVSDGTLTGYVSSDYITLDPVGSSGPFGLMLRGGYTV